MFINGEKAVAPFLNIHLSSWHLSGETEGGTKNRACPKHKSIEIHRYINSSFMESQEEQVILKHMKLK
jgi:hypothetical protein